MQEDIAFARGLATEWGLVDLAGEVIAAIGQEGTSDQTGERLQVVRCELYAQAAIAELDRQRRNELFEQAVSAYEAFLETHQDSAAFLEAESAYIKTCALFARSLEIALEEAVGEQAETLRLRRIEILTAAIQHSGELLDELLAEPGSSEVERRERLEVMLTHGRLLLELGRSQRNGEFLFQQAHRILEEVAFDQGEGTPGALRAFDLIGRVYSAQQDWEQAIAYFEAVIDQVLSTDSEQWAKTVKQLGLSSVDKEQRWLFVELTTDGLCEALMATGRVREACHYALHLVNTQKREGFAYSTTLGYPSLLAAAWTLLDSGGVVGGDLERGHGRWYATDREAADDGVTKRRRRSAAEVALTIARRVVAENQKNILRVRGQELIAEITRRPGVAIDPRDLYAAAEGKYNNQEYEPALEAFKLVLVALQHEDRAARVELAPMTLYRMGRAHQRLGRHLEACLAFREGCTTWSGDPEYDTANAQAFYDSAQVLQRRAPGDDVVETLCEEAEIIAAAKNVGDRGKILSNLARKKLLEEDYEGAVGFFREIERTAALYEKVVVTIGVCRFRQGEKDEAYSIFVDYLETFVTDPLNAVEDDAERKARRHEAKAIAGFYRALIEYDREDYAAVIENARDYYRLFPEQTSFAPWTMRLVGSSLVRAGELDEAKSYLELALERYPDSKHVAIFAIVLYKELKERHATADGDQRVWLLRQMAELLEVANEAATSKSFQNLREESRHWFDLQEWEKARSRLEELITEFGADDAHEEDLVRYVKPDLSHVLLELHRTGEAHAILSVLVGRTDRKPSKRTLLDYTRAVTGWVEGDAFDIRIVPGAGLTAAELRDATEKLNAMAGGVEKKWTCEWYDLKFRLAYGYHVWATAEGGPRDSRKQDTARAQLDVLVQDLGADFRGSAHVPGVDRTCDEDPERAPALGEDVLRRRLVWLWKKVR